MKKTILLCTVLFSSSIMVSSCTGAKKGGEMYSDNVKPMMDQITAATEYKNLKSKDANHSVVVLYTVPNDQIVDSPKNNQYARMARISKYVGTSTTPPYPYPYLEQYLITYSKAENLIISIKKEY